MMFYYGSANVQTAAEDGVRLWDLRKLRNFKSFLSADANSGMELLYPILVVCFVDREIST